MRWQSAAQVASSLAVCFLPASPQGGVARQILSAGIADYKVQIAHTLSKPYLLAHTIGRSCFYSLKYRSLAAAALTLHTLGPGPECRKLACCAA